MQAEDQEKPLVLVVDDDRTTRTVHKAILASAYRVVAVESGDQAIAVYAQMQPDLIVLDVEMPGLNGYQTCQKIRQTSTVPIIFVTVHSSLESQLEAFEAGGNDVVTKPVAKEVFMYKVALAIKNHAEYQRLMLEMNSLQVMAMNFLSTVGETGVLLNFLRGSISCRNYDDLAQKLVEAARALEMECYGVIRTPTGNHDFRSHGEPTVLEREVLSKLSTMGRIFQFKRQLVVNYDKVSVVVVNLPIESDEKTGGIRDNLCVLVEAAEALCDNVAMRQESMGRAEQLQVALMGASSTIESLREDHRGMLGDTRILLQELVDEVEKSYSWLGTSSDQERAINSMMNKSVQNILDMLMTRGQFDGQFKSVLDAMRGTQSGSDIDLW